MMTQHEDFESSPDAYSVKLDAFEGPLDLLLFLIRKNEVNIYDIPISLVTEQYLAVHRADAGAEPRRGGRVPGDGGDAHPHQVEDAAAAARHGAGRRGRGRGPARGAGAAAARAPEVPRRGGAAARARSAARRAAHAARRARGGRGGRRLRARARSRSLQPDGGVPGRARARLAQAADGDSAGADLDRGPHRAAAVAAVGDRGVRIRGSVRGWRRVEAVPHRDVPGAAGDDSAEAGARVPGRRRRRDQNLQAGPPGRCAASDWRSRS